MEFVAIDFETANEFRSSACAIGFAVVSDNKIVERQQYLIKPPMMYFNPFNVALHGITEKHVKNEPHFNELWPSIKCFFEKRLIVAHNASFDISVLRNTLDEYQVPYPEFDYCCTRIISKATWPNHVSYALNHMAAYLGLDFIHHNAEEDAVACANVLIRAAKELGVKSQLELAELSKVKAFKTVANTENDDQNHRLYGNYRGEYLIVF
ncbi:MAG: exonuclease [Firmicutes bacterium HGW-Firmicutes-12]|jgi:DNA polymerase-3 subunit epsilon|nr:MAG: exonuclease [Firmicutes bacterium HGW-Firmicutes-12]